MFTKLRRTFPALSRFPRGKSRASSRKEMRMAQGQAKALEDRAILEDNAVETNSRDLGEVDHQARVSKTGNRTA